MKLDIRLPIGFLFTILGAMLVLYGVFSESTIYQRSLGVNINLYWGIALAVFGAIMLFLSRRSSTRKTS